MARAYDWEQFPDPLLGAIMARTAIDLSTALTVFLNADPARFNYLSKRDTPPQFHALVLALDNICMRINSGFYRPSDGQRVDGHKRLETWLFCQLMDREEHRCGRWVLDETIVSEALSPYAHDPQDRTGLTIMTALRKGQKPVRHSPDAPPAGVVRRLQRLMGIRW